MVSTVGGSVADPAADGEGNLNIINAALAKGVKKFVLVTSVGCGSSRDAPGEKVYTALKPVLVEKDRAEAALMVRGGRVHGASGGCGRGIVVVLHAMAVEGCWEHGSCRLHIRDAALLFALS